MRANHFHKLEPKKTSVFEKLLGLGDLDAKLVFEWISQTEVLRSAPRTDTSHIFVASTILANWATESVETLATEAEKLNAAWTVARGSIFLNSLYDSGTPDTQTVVEGLIQRRIEDGITPDQSYTNAAQQASSAAFRKMIFGLLELHRSKVAE